MQCLGLSNNGEVNSLQSIKPFFIVVLWKVIETTTEE